jgi:hypothetical protein
MKDKKCAYCGKPIDGGTACCGDICCESSKVDKNKIESMWTLHYQKRGNFRGMERYWGITVLEGTGKKEDPYREVVYIHDRKGNELGTLERKEYGT